MRENSSLYPESVKERICQLLIQGRSLRSICENEPGMPAESTVRLWASQDSEFSAQYMRARDLQADKFADEIIEIADGANSEDASVARLKFDARRWYVSKVLPKKYGERINVDQQTTQTIHIDFGNMSVEERMEMLKKLEKSTNSDK